MTEIKDPHLGGEWHAPKAPVPEPIRVIVPAVTATVATTEPARNIIPLNAGITEVTQES